MHTAMTHSQKNINDSVRLRTTEKQRRTIEENEEKRLRLQTLNLFEEWNEISFFENILNKNREIDQRI